MMADAGERVPCAYRAARILCPASSPVVDVPMGKSLAQLRPSDAQSYRTAPALQAAKTAEIGHLLETLAC